MKKILLGSIALFLFAISIALLQISCGKNANANPDNNIGVNQLNKILYIKSFNGAQGSEIWIANYDGSGQTRVNVTIPSGYSQPSNACLSPDGKKIFFQSYPSVSTVTAILSCNIDGTNVVEVIGTDNGSPYIQGAY